MSAGESLRARIPAINVLKASSPGASLETTAVVTCGTDATMIGISGLRSGSPFDGSIVAAGDSDTFMVRSAFPTPGLLGSPGAFTGTRCSNTTNVASASSWIATTRTAVGAETAAMRRASAT